ncbi:DNA cytosine methyltransferase [Haloarcula sp. Atlit-7R]|uniref:DNA cytosine methyltransferase n=1 Tax=Haloarcula sp. Atlit-7R TaxID=2282125 RepID=UPI000EF165B5|nr:DNA cytosine methyltransferase [Haloarcula sp. Atlit-7R]RLM94365.1 DNA methyltransferase [Haloarcula sp. Atlit-7R]
MSVTDSQKPIVAIDLFCGAGGFSAALDRVGETLNREVHHSGVNHDEAAIKSYKANRSDAICYNRKAQALNPGEVLYDRLTEIAYDRCDDPDVTREEIEPVDRDEVELILTAGPQCTAFSQASGGKPDPSNQPRVSAFEVLTWINQLPGGVDIFVLENVGGIRRWGPVVDDEYHDDGAVFNQWINTMSSMGYAVDWKMLEASDFGDPTSRERFILLGKKEGTVSFPEPTHDDDDPNKPDRRTAAEIIDWDDLGSSIWDRHKHRSRVTPPASTTLNRIAEGLRRHCHDSLEPFADVLETFDRDTVHDLRENRVIPREYVAEAVQALDEPFLVRFGAHEKEASTHYLLKYYGTSPPKPVDVPIDAITAGGNKYAPTTASTYLLRQQDQYGSPVDVTKESTPTVTASGSHQIVTPAITSLIAPRNQWARGTHSNPLYPADSKPLHTVTAKNHDGHLATPSLVRLSHGGRALDCNKPVPALQTTGGDYNLATPYLTPLYNGRKGQQPRTRCLTRPLMTVPASKSPAQLITPGAAFIDDCQGEPKPLDKPLNTQPASDRFALVVPDLVQDGLNFALDVKYRMLKPIELKMAQGFAEDFELKGSKTERTAQIGNAVPVNMARAVLLHALSDESVSLASFGGGIQEPEDVSLPDYETFRTRSRSQG